MIQRFIVPYRFSESCPFDAKKSKYPKLAQLANVGNCKAFAAGCPFKPERQEHESCPVLAGWHEALHPPVHALDNVAHDCIAFKQQAGCPFREASSDKDHRMMGMIDGALDVIKEKCPAWSAGTCPFSKDSNAHPEITSAAQVADCPAFKGKSCVFNAASPPTDAHPNIAYLFTKSVKDCSAFTGYCACGLHVSTCWSCSPTCLVAARSLHLVARSRHRRRQWVVL